MLWFLWDVLINILEYLFVYILLKQKLGYSSSKRKWIIISTAFLIAVVTAMNYYAVNTQVIVGVMYCLRMAYALALFKGTPAMRIMWASAASIIFVMANLIVSFLVTNIEFINVQMALTSSFARLVPTII